MQTILKTLKKVGQKMNGFQLSHEKNNGEKVLFNPETKETLTVKVWPCKENLDKSFGRVGYESLYN